MPDSRSLLNSPETRKTKNLIILLKIANHEKSSPGFHLYIIDNRITSAAQCYEWSAAYCCDNSKVKRNNKHIPTYTDSDTLSNKYVKRIPFKVWYVLFRKCRELEIKYTRCIPNISFPTHTKRLGECIVTYFLFSIVICLYVCFTEKYVLPKLFVIIAVN